MELLEAIKSRRSIRAFKPDPVPKKVLTQLLDVARQAPSGANNQPWEFYIFMGEARDKLTNAMLEKWRLKGMKSLSPDIKMFLKHPKGPYEKRQNVFFRQFLDLIEPEDGKKKMQKWLELSFSQYGAPALIIIAVDKMASGWFIFDTGSITQTIALVAQEYGLGTCILGDVTAYPEEIRRIASIPESKQAIIGIAIGYPDWDDPLNSLRTDREPVEKLVTWCEKTGEKNK